MRDAILGRTTKEKDFSDRQTGGRTDGRTDRQTDGRTDLSDRLTETDRWKDGQMALFQ